VVERIRKSVKKSMITTSHPSEEQGQVAGANAELLRRRTFAIISHPDAGKTTLTEKLLLYGGALHLAGSVTARKNQRSSSSDWMALEQQRGISVSSTVLQFEYEGSCINLLDTPGHRDFSEDTYRVLTAVDSAVMVIDAAKGIESQTQKLFEICRRRQVPIFTFINKLDRPARPILELLDELESVLGIAAVPVNWPLGDGPYFKGVYDRVNKQVHLFERTPGGVYRAPVKVAGIEDALVREVLPVEVYEQVKEELEMLDGLGLKVDQEKVDSGMMTPVFFGSAVSNFGVQLLLDQFLEMAPCPKPRWSGERLVEPSEGAFSAFVFKIQANMNPKHRDRVAFIRVVSGCFERDMTVWNTRSGERIRLSNSQRLFAQERHTVDEAWPGDVVGIVGNQDFQIGDTLAKEIDVRFSEIPTFSPECFAYLHNVSTSKHKRFRAGIEQLLKEGVARLFSLPDSGSQIPLIGAVGPLQFEVLQYRLEMEYGAPSRVEMATWKFARWIEGAGEGSAKPGLELPMGAVLAMDVNQCWLVLLDSEWAVKCLQENNPNVVFLDEPGEIQLPDMSGKSRRGR